MIKKKATPILKKKMSTKKTNSVVKKKMSVKNKTETKKTTKRNTTPSVFPSIEQMPTDDNLGLKFNVIDIYEDNTELDIVAMGNSILTMGHLILEMGNSILAMSDSGNEDTVDSFFSSKDNEGDEVSINTMSSSGFVD